jgi:predicted RNA polymerase sigma factor
MSCRSAAVSARCSRAHELGGEGGFYVLQAMIVACHAEAATADVTDWRRIANLYATLAARVRSPVIELNRAVAVGMADGPAAGLESSTASRTNRR